VHYTYVLLSKRDERFYTGCTDDLQKRVLEHKAGRVRSTAHRVALELLFYEACPNRDDALRRERFLKTGQGKRFLKRRLTAFLEGISWNKLERH
jgi:putative endonuclease